MPGYVLLLKYTQQGLANMKAVPERHQVNKAAAEEMGIRSVGTWWTMGAYDAVAVVDAPDDQTVTAFVLALARAGNATTQTMRAFSEEEFAQIVSKLQ